MRVELVCPAAGDSARLRSLALATLAGLPPRDVEISVKDDTVRLSFLARLLPAPEPPPAAPDDG